LHQRGDPKPYPLKPTSLHPNDSYTYYLPSVSEVPEGFIGAGTFTANGPISVVVLHVNADKAAASSYTGIPNATPNVSMPLLFKAADGWDTGVQVYNVGGQDTVVTLAYLL